MKKIFRNLIATGLSLVLALTLVVTVSYAWLSMSTNPVASGIQITIGGGKTILLAPDLTKVLDDGTVVHYPGAFDNKLNFSQLDAYDYLNNVAALLPVSTADGVNWFLPTYNAYGTLQDLDSFELDNRLLHANPENAGNGGYLYLDFWVVSPGPEYNVRVSTDTRNGQGSFLIDLPQVIKSTSSVSGYTLSPCDNRLLSTARIGFLVNNDRAPDRNMAEYMASPVFDDRFHSLLGSYAEPGQADPSGNNVFTVYEPGGLVHYAQDIEQGAYAVTNPLGLDEDSGRVTMKDIRDRVTVQKGNAWKTTADSMLLEQILQTALAGHSDLNMEEAQNCFYQTYLQSQVSSYVSSGSFFASTNALMGRVSVDGMASAEDLAYLKTGGATDDVIITRLQRNTPQRIRMFIWLEGQDADCVALSGVKSSGFALGLELSGAQNE